MPKVAMLLGLAGLVLAGSVGSSSALPFMPAGKDAIIKDLGNDLTDVRWRRCWRDRWGRVRCRWCSRDRWGRIHCW
jgi:hypothetical protein